MSRQLFRIPIAAYAAVVALALASPAAAQMMGSLKGRILDDKGHAIREAAVTLSFPADPTVKAQQILTDETGEFSMDSLRFGMYEIEARKGNLVGKFKAPVQVRANDMTDAGELMLHVAAPEEIKVVTTDDVAKVAAANEERKRVKSDIDAASAAIAAGNPDEAITRLTAVVAKPGMESCAGCYTLLGDAYEKKADDASAEKAYLKAIEILPDKADVAGAYAGLATIYNKQGKLDDAAKMSTKANDLLEAGGGGNASTAYNQGIILWNQGDKAPEAETQFRKAIKLDPKMADAQYYLGMTLVNQGKLADAKEPFTEYLKLDPKGKFAQDVKDMLAMIK